MATIYRLKKEENYKFFGSRKKNCTNCTHHERDDNYAGTGVTVNLCTQFVDKDTGGVVILPEDCGVCDGYD